jgi:hypothetical protein
VLKFLQIGSSKFEAVRCCFGLLIIASCTAFLSVQAFGLPRGALKIPSSNVFVTSGASGAFTCGKPSSKWVAGTLIGSQKDYFISYATEIKNAKADILRASAAKKKKLLAKIKSLSAKLSPGSTACKNGPPTTPTPTGNFDSFGNVTAAGKLRFGIPQYLSASISQGRTVQNLNCNGCHLERVDYTFSTLRQKIAQAPMYYDSSQIPDSDLAQLTAYLNRYNQ